VLAAWTAQPRTPQTELEMEDENLLIVATALVAAALARTDSLGAHWRSDQPRREADLASRTLESAAC
jgi:L-aspartate oxidase